ncbi:MAG: DUF1501 domain-containing protein [Rubrivivax sp.]|nr:MAG: DUF1501 domain-containing protein [Rubrivivax sp.]
MSSSSRRAFLRHAIGFSSLGAAGSLGLSLATLGKASAQSAGGYQALVCVFLYGGNDAYNTVLATDSASWGHYRSHRDPRSRVASDTSTSIALLGPGTPANLSAEAGTPERLGGVLPIAHSGRAANAGRQFALHPSLTRLQGLYQERRLAVLANVGPLIQPTTKANYASSSFAKPAKLFSHNDQYSTWQSFSPEGAGAGWGGRMGDLLMSQNGLSSQGERRGIVQNSFTCLTPGGSSIWLSGHAVTPYQSGNTAVASLGSNGKLFESAAAQAAVMAVMNDATDTNLFAQAHQQVVARALKAQDLIAPGFPAQAQSPWGTPGKDTWTDPLLKYTGIDGQAKTNQLAIQLQMVARMIDVNRTAGLGAQRQVFMVSLGGFDSHDNQNQDHADRMLQLNHALAYFDTVLGRMPAGDMRSQVTTFTASDFGRSFTNNGDGTDHGWGGHHLIMGGAVQGGEVYGTFPQYSTADGNGVFSSPDQIANGVMLPTTSVDQYAYTLGKWMGVSPTDLAGILPNLNNFNASAHNLGFMG